MGLAKQEPTDTRAVEIVFSNISRFVPGMLVSCRNPGKFSKGLKISPETVAWLTEITTEEKHMNPRRLDFEVKQVIMSGSP